MIVYCISRYRWCELVASFLLSEILKLPDVATLAEITTLHVGSGWAIRGVKRRLNQLLHLFPPPVMCSRCTFRLLYSVNPPSPDHVGGKRAGSIG